MTYNMPSSVKKSTEAETCLTAKVFSSFFFFFFRQASLKIV